MRRLAVLGAVAALAAGCGGGTTPKAHGPRLPRALAQSWSRQADAVAAALTAGDGCAAQQRANALRTQVIAAVDAGRIPARLLEPLTSAVNELPSRIACTPPAASAPPKHGPPPKHEPPPKHGPAPKKPKPPGPGPGHGPKHGGKP
ncbi:MAG TPA: hypothetical protein VFA30_06885 [Gaiellaceae bacterium]|nr:hypothetical protein [Gaiellaceae bacterium]